MMKAAHEHAENHWLDSTKDNYIMRLRFELGKQVKILRCPRNGKLLCFIRQSIKPGYQLTTLRSYF